MPSAKDMQRDNSQPLERYPADLEHKGWVAGPISNRQMADVAMR